MRREEEEGVSGREREGEFVEEDDSWWRRGFASICTYYTILKRQKRRRGEPVYGVIANIPGS